MTPVLDILFRAIGTEVPTDHGFALFGALSRILETEEDQWMHGNPHIGLHTVRGTSLGNGRILIGPNARLGLRLPHDLLPRSLKLAGKRLDLYGCKLRGGGGGVPLSRNLKKYFKKILVRTRPPRLDGGEARLDWNWQISTGTLMNNQ